MQTSTRKKPSQKAKIGPEAQWINNSNPVKLKLNPVNQGGGTELGTDNMSQDLKPPNS